MNSTRSVKAKHILMTISACLISACSAPPLSDSQQQVHGVVMDQEGKSITNAVVRLLSREEEKELFKIKTEQNGNFNFSLVPKEGAKISIEKTGFSGLKTGNFWGIDGKVLQFSFMLPIKKSACEQSDGHGSIAGTVTDDTGEPLPGTNIIIQGIDLRAISNFNGQFKLDKIPSGLYNVSIAEIGYMEVHYTAICIETDSVCTLNVVLSPIKVKQNIPPGRNFQIY